MVRDVTREIREGGVGPLGAGRDGEEGEQIVCFLFYLFPLSFLTGDWGRNYDPQG